MENINKDRIEMEESIKKAIIDFTIKNQNFMVSEIRLKNDICTIVNIKKSFLSTVSVSTKIELI